jgi:predicted HicB family RNase H-like nuclease
MNSKQKRTLALIFAEPVPASMAWADKAAFREAVDDYLAACARVGKAPQKPYSGRVMFRISPEVHQCAALAAELSGQSLNQWAEAVLGKAAAEAPGRRASRR